MDIEKIKQKLLDLDKKKKIKFIVLFGSYAAGRQGPFSDIDIAVYYDGDLEERFRFRLNALGELSEKVDLQIFQNLPVAVRKEILAGKVLFSKDYDFTFNVFMETIKEYDLFEKYLNEYLAAVEKRLGIADGY